MDKIFEVDQVTREEAEMLAKLFRNSEGHREFLNGYAAGVEAERALAAGKETA